MSKVRFLRVAPEGGLEPQPSLEAALGALGGMSEWSMMTGPENWRTAYPAFLAGMAAIGVASFFA